MGFSDPHRGEAGFTLVEILVAIGILSFISAGFMMVMLSANRGSNTARDVAEVSAEARLGFNRLLRDVRQASAIEPLPAPGPTGFRIFVDYDGNQIRPTPAATDLNADGDYEVLTYTFHPDAQEIRLNGEVLMEGTDCPRAPSGACSQSLTGSAPWAATYGAAPPNVFGYLSNRLEYDWNKDGVTTWQELDTASTHPGGVGVGNNNGILDGPELRYVSSIAFDLVVRNGDSESRFTAEAQLRNQR